MAKQKMVPKTPVERAIHMKRIVIARWQKKIKDAQAWADEDIRIIKKKLDRDRVLLEALERGALKP